MPQSYNINTKLANIVRKRNVITTSGKNKTTAALLRATVANLSNAKKRLFLLAVAVTAQELINTTSGVDQFLLAGEEWVRRTSNLKLHQWIGLTVNLNSLLGVDC